MRFALLMLTGLALALPTGAFAQGPRAAPWTVPNPVDPHCADPGAAQLLILGTYHMANPGLDGENVEADDVRSPRRQAEIAELLDRLERFQPGRIAIEAKYGSSVWPERYHRHLAGEYEMGRNETEQIGFRLAERLGHETVYPIDYPIWMNGWASDEIDYAANRAQRQSQEAG